MMVVITGFSLPWQKESWLRAGWLHNALTVELQVNIYIYYNIVLSAYYISWKKRFNIIILHALLYYMHRWLRQNTRSHPFHFVMAWSISQQNPVWWCLVFRGFKCFAQEVELRRIQENSTVCVFRAANLLLFHDSLLPALTIDSEQLFSLVFFCCLVDLSLSLLCFLSTLEYKLACLAAVNARVENWKSRMSTNVYKRIPRDHRFQSQMKDMLGNHPQPTQNQSIHSSR